MKKYLVTLFIILGVILFSVIILNKPQPDILEGVVKCIGQNSELYVQTGCHACKIQEDIFGENKNYLNAIDCFKESEKCSGITHTPTWIIKGEKYEGVQSIEKLKELTGC
ncbi:MAG: hypothetical protein ABIH79_01905 [archaeon]